MECRTWFSFSHPPIESELRGKTNDLVLNFEFLPDPMVSEAEWQTNLPLVHELESIWADQKHRAPSAYLLQQARTALILRRLFRPHNIRHVHATSSRTLLCGYFLKRLLGLNWSAVIEPRPVFHRKRSSRKCSSIPELEHGGLEVEVRCRSGQNN